MPVLTAVKEEIFPVPAAARPIPVVLFVHVYVVIPTVLFVVKMTGETGEPSQTTWSAGSFTCPAGLTVMEKDCDKPSQVSRPSVE